MRIILYFYSLGTRYNLKKLNIIDQRFITFGLVHGFIRRIHEYAVNEDHDSTFATSSSHSSHNSSRSSRSNNNHLRRSERASFSNDPQIQSEQEVDNQVSELSERETGESISVCVCLCLCL